MVSGPAAWPRCSTGCARERGKGVAPALRPVLGRGGRHDGGGAGGRGSAGEGGDPSGEGGRGEGAEGGVREEEERGVRGVGVPGGLAGEGEGGRPRPRLPFGDFG